MSRMDDRTIGELMRTLRERLPPSQPDWTDGSQHDPGVTLADLLVYLGDELLARATRLPASVRRDLGRLGSRLMGLDTGDGGVDVHVNGERWQPVASFADTSPDAAVFTLDEERGTVRFGDGVHGRRPPEGATIRATYRQGGGNGAGEVAITSRWPLDDRQWMVTTRARGDIRLLGRTATSLAGSPLERVSYFAGQLLTADDYRAEQDYIRSRLRRLNRARYGTGVVAGLQLSITADPDSPALLVSPGLAIDPNGEEIVVTDPLSCPIVATGDAVHVTVRFVERPAAFAPALDGTGDDRRPTRIEEGFAVAFERDPDPGGVVLGRLVRDDSGWHVAPSARPNAPPGSL